MTVIVPPIERLLSNAVLDGTCWRIAGGMVRDDGYSQVQLTGKRAPKVLGHRLSYEFFVAEIPDGLDLDHVWEWGCRFRACVNFSHLEPVTRAVNIERGSQRERACAYWDAYWQNRTHCDRGHSLAEVGIDIEAGTGHRKCRRCHLDQKIANHQRAMADPVKAASIRERNRLAVARYRAKKAVAA